MIVLSLFDGMATGRLALERAGLPVTAYYASEIDPYSIRVARKNYPDIVHLGDVRNWRTWNIPRPNLIIGGFPCQGFSKIGQGDHFDDPRSRLFYDMVDILSHYKPQWFLAENVVMRKSSSDIITNYLGVIPIKINSYLVSAQLRERVYWTDIPEVDQPEDRGILFHEVLTSGIPLGDKSYAIDANYYKRGGLYDHFKLPFRQLSTRSRRVSIVEPSTAIEIAKQKDPVLYGSLIRGFTLLQDMWDTGGYTCFDVTHPDFKDVTAHLADATPGQLRELQALRHASPVECERLQTLPDGYTAGVSNTQRYRMLGNGWTADAAAHIFSRLA